MTLCLHICYWIFQFILERFHFHKRRQYINEQLVNVQRIRDCRKFSAEWGIYDIYGIYPLSQDSGIIAEMGVDII